MHSRKPSKLRLRLAVLSWEVGQDPRGDLICELLGDAIRFIGKLVVSSLDESGRVRKCNTTEWSLTG